MEPLRDYDYQPELLEDAFFTFKIDKPLGDNRLRLVRYHDTIADADEQLFALPDIIDEDKSPYADLLDHVTRVLNDLIDFERKLTVEELEEEIREEQNNQYMEGRAVHMFNEMTGILEYVPAGYELEDEDEPSKDAEETIGDEFPDMDDSDEEIVRDETMNWDDDEEAGEAEDDEDLLQPLPSEDGEDNEEDER